MRQILTVGYEGSDLDTLIEVLLAAKVEVIADVREIPLSRKRGFSKRAFAARLEYEGIQYIHFRDLGDPKPGRIAARQGNFREFRRIFSNHMKTDAAKKSLANILEIAKTKRVCLICYENNPTNCHRSIVSKGIAKKNFHIVDLDGTGITSPRRTRQQRTRYDYREGVAAT